MGLLSVREVISFRRTCNEKCGNSSTLPRTMCGKGNQYAQYVLGKLYLCGRDVSRDREKAVEYLTASAEQGNLYASFLLEHLDAYQDPSLFLAATRLLHHLESCFAKKYRDQWK